jgi:hypothetical protein
MLLGGIGGPLNRHTNDDKRIDVFIMDAHSMSVRHAAERACSSLPLQVAARRMEQSKDEGRRYQLPVQPGPVGVYTSSHAYLPHHIYHLLCTVQRSQ